LLDQGARPYLGPDSLTSIARRQSKDEGMYSPVATSPSAPAPFQAPTKTLSPLEKRVINFLQRNSRSTVEQLAHVLIIPETELTSALILMEMNNLIMIKGKTVSLLSGVSN